MRLERVLRAVLEDVGADAVRVVDGPTGTVLAAVGDDHEDLAALLADTGDGPPKAGDLVVPIGGAVHVLRGLAGPFVHVRLVAGADVAAARRALADPGLHAAVRAGAVARAAEPGAPTGPQAVVRRTAPAASDGGCASRGTLAAALPEIPGARPGSPVAHEPAVPAPRVPTAGRRPSPRRSGPAAARRGSRPVPRRSAPSPLAAPPPAAAVDALENPLAAPPPSVAPPSPSPPPVDVPPFPRAGSGPSALTVSARTPDAPRRFQPFRPDVIVPAEPAPCPPAAGVPAPVPGLPCPSVFDPPSPVPPAPAPARSFSAPADGTVVPAQSRATEPAPCPSIFAPPRPAVAPPRPAVAPPRPAVAPPRPAVAPPRPAVAPPRPAVAPPPRPSMPTRTPSAVPPPCPSAEPLTIAAAATLALGPAEPLPQPARSPVAVATLTRGTLPALARIGVPAARSSLGARAVEALGTDDASPLDSASWSRDLSTLRRVLDGLHRMA